MPAGGGTSQTAVNRLAGARTQLAGITTAGVTLLTMLVLAPVIGLMPQATLSLRPERGRAPDVGPVFFIPGGFDADCVRPRVLVTTSAVNKPTSLRLVGAVLCAAFLLWNSPDRAAEDNLEKK